jgi:hypothetical protein
MHFAPITHIAAPDVPGVLHGVLHGARLRTLAL